MSYWLCISMLLSRWTSLSFAAYLCFLLLLAASYCLQHACCVFKTCQESQCDWMVPGLSFCVSREETWGVQTMTKFNELHSTVDFIQSQWWVFWVRGPFKAESTSYIPLKKSGVLNDRLTSFNFLSGWSARGGKGTHARAFPATRCRCDWTGSGLLGITTQPTFIVRELPFL